jgi:hypothetical protein
MGIRKILDWSGQKWDEFLLRRRMRVRAAFLVWLREIEPKILHYLETLECRVESQEKELRALRWALKGEQMGHWDEEQDIRDWKIRTGADTSRKD